MAEYIEIGNQTVALNNPIVFNASIPCPRGYVIHDNGTGNFTLRGATPNCFARYQLIWNGNVQIPTGGEVTPVGIAISVNGKVRSTIKVNKDIEDKELEKIALGLDAVQKHIEGKTVRKVIIVKGKIVNIVAN